MASDYVLSEPQPPWPFRPAQGDPLPVESEPQPPLKLPPPAQPNGSVNGADCPHDGPQPHPPWDDDEGGGLLSLVRA